MQALVPPGAAARYVDTSYGRLRLLQAGTPTERPPAVLVHGGGSDNASISWHRLMAPLAEDRAVWAPDLPGFGGSIDAAPVGGPDAMADVVDEVLNRIGAPPAVVFGVSMGGDVALNLALSHPRRVAALVLVAPGGLVPFVRNRITHAAAWGGGPTARLATAADGSICQPICAQRVAGDGQGSGHDPARSFR